MNGKNAATVLPPSIRRKFCFYLPLVTLTAAVVIAITALASYAVPAISKGNSPAVGNPEGYILIIAGSSVLLVSLIFFTVAATISCLLTFSLSFLPWKSKIAAFLFAVGLHSVGVAVAIYFIVSPFR